MGPQQIESVFMALKKCKIGIQRQCFPGDWVREHGVSQADHSIDELLS